MENNEMLQPTQPVPEPVVATDYQISSKKGSPMRIAGLVGVFVLIVLAGAGTGYGLSKIMKGGASTSPGGTSAAPGSLSANQVEVGKTYGTEDAKKFPDTSEGIIEKGGMDGEGTHHLVRPGGKSQTVYMTSSVVDLDLFVGDKVQVKGETFSAQKAAWFMDVGSVKVLELNSQLPAGAEESPSTIPAE